VAIARPEPREHVGRGGNDERSARVDRDELERFEPDLEHAPPDQAAEPLPDLVPVIALGDAGDAETSADLTEVNPDRSAARTAASADASHGGADEMELAIGGPPQDPIGEIHHWTAAGVTAPPVVSAHLSSKCPAADSTAMPENEKRANPSGASAIAPPSRLIVGFGGLLTAAQSPVSAVPPLVMLASTTT
jgi:hypothetical protein